MLGPLWGLLMVSWTSHHYTLLNHGPQALSEPEPGLPLQPLSPISAHITSLGSTISHLLMTQPLPNPGCAGHWPLLETRQQGVCALSLHMEGHWYIPSAWHMFAEWRKKVYVGTSFSKPFSSFQNCKTLFCILLDLTNLINNHFILPNYDSVAPI